MIDKMGWRERNRDEENRRRRERQQTDKQREPDPEIDEEIVRLHNWLREPSRPKCGRF